MGKWSVRPELRQPPDNFDTPTIHVWNASLSVSPKDLDRYGNVLSADERERAARFHFDIHRCRFVAGRGILRRLLGHYTGKDPAEIEFLYGANRKPALRTSGLHFNLSHSEDRAVFAFTSIAPVGVDMECLRPVPGMMQIAERFFSPFEFDTISAFPDDQRNAAFLRCWTRKEAVIKSTGEGLACPLDGFEVSFEATTQIVTVNRNEAEQERVFLYGLDLDEYIGAVACRRPCNRVMLLQYSSLSNLQGDAGFRCALHP